MLTSVATDLPSAAGETSRRMPLDVVREPMLAVEDLHVRFGSVAAVDGVSLTIGTGEVVCLVGPSGSGKSTLLRVIAGIERPSSGRVLVGGVEVSGSGHFVEPEHRRIGMVFQDYALFPHLTVAANVAFGLRGRRRAAIRAVVDPLLERIGLSRHANSYPHMLSGGERQRVALARAVAPSPRALLMDEPFSSLDSRLRDRVRRDTLDLLREIGTTTVIVTHDPDEAMRCADRIALLRGGRLVQCGSPSTLYARPASRFSARFFSDINDIPGTCREGWLDTPLGSFPAPPNQAWACACIRPQHLRLASGPTKVAGRVVSATFLGECDQIVVEACGLSTPLTVRTAGPSGLAPGDLVHLDVRPEDVLVVPDDGD